MEAAAQSYLRPSHNIMKRYIPVLILAVILGKEAAYLFLSRLQPGPQLCTVSRALGPFHGSSCTFLPQAPTLHFQACSGFPPLRQPCEWLPAGWHPHQIWPLAAAGAPQTWKLIGTGAALSQPSIASQGSLFACKHLKLSLVQIIIRMLLDSGIGQILTHISQMSYGVY